MVFQKRSWLLILLLLALVGAIAFPIIHISKTENLYPIVSSYGYGYMNQVGELVIYPQFDRAEKFSEGFAPVKVKDKLGFVNFKGQVSITLPNNIVDESNSGKRDEPIKSSTDFFDKVLKDSADKKLMDKRRDEYDTLSTSFSEG